MEPKPTEPSHLSLDHIVAQSSVHVTFEPKETTSELKSRLVREEADAVLKRTKDLILFRAVIVIVSVVAAACLIASFLPIVPEDTRKSAFSLLTVIVTAAVSFMVGKSVK
jgi:hypothetical protein